MQTTGHSDETATPSSPGGPTPASSSGLRDWVRTHRGLVLAGGIGAGVVLVGVVVASLFWFGFQNAFIDSEVQDEVIEAAEPATTAPPASASDSAQAPTTAAPVEPVLVSESEIIDLDHAGIGTAQLIRNPDGSHAIQFLGLDVSNGPDLRVILSPAEITPDAGAYDAGLVDLGALRGNVGNQVYEIPAEIDVSQFNSAAIWCRRFNSTFNAAAIGA